MGRLCTAKLGGRRGLLESELDAVLSTAASKTTRDTKPELDIQDENDFNVLDENSKIVQQG
jgi:hypothetical protein